jgi:hypothetical protein
VTHFGPKNYATHARPSASDHLHVPKRKTFGSDHATMDALREGDKKSARKSEVFSEKKKYAFCVDSAPEMTVKGLKNKRKKNQ